MALGYILSGCQSHGGYDVNQAEANMQKNAGPSAQKHLEPLQEGDQAGPNRATVYGPYATPSGERDTYERNANKKQASADQRLRRMALQSGRPLA